MLNDLEVTELLVAKICHDLSGPIGAIHNGFEFFQEENQLMRERAIKLIETSAQQSVIRLQFFRQLYGISPSIGEANLGELRMLAKNFFADQKVRIVWPDENMIISGIIVDHKFAKTILNLIHIAGLMLIRGGSVTVQLQKSLHGKKVSVVGEGETLKHDNTTIQILQNNLQDITINTKNINVYLINRLIQSINAKLTINLNETRILFEVE
ncbi:MAG: histidine phosphotransferase family protein [Rickettsiales endosymbiont of Dermacentor nuttalli]